MLIPIRTANNVQVMLSHIIIAAAVATFKDSQSFDNGILTIVSHKDNNSFEIPRPSFPNIMIELVSFKLVISIEELSFEVPMNLAPFFFNSLISSEFIILIC